jgi:uncharacterized lipoprotein YajG
MKIKLILLAAALLLTGCVSTSRVQEMIDENNQVVLNPRFEEIEAGLGRSTRLTEQQRQVMIRHFELLGKLSANALSELRKEDGALSY